MSSATSCVSPKSHSFFSASRVTPLVLPESEFLIWLCNTTPACNWESTQWARMIVAQMSAAPSPKCVSRVCIVWLWTCETEIDTKYRRVGGANWMKTRLHVRVQPSLSSFGITGAWCIKVYVVLYVISPCKTVVLWAVSAIYIMENFISASRQRLEAVCVKFQPLPPLLRQQNKPRFSKV